MKPKGINIGGSLLYFTSFAGSTSHEAIRVPTERGASTC